MILGIGVCFQNIKLQLADHANDVIRANDPAKYLNDSLLGQIFQRALELLGFYWIFQPYPAQNFRREVRDANDLDLLAFG